MNYLKIYYQLIEKRKKNPPLKDFEKHHILPKSLFPKFAKDKQNLVKLTYREHYLAHHLLYRYYKSIGDKNATYKMAKAWLRLCQNVNGLHVSSHEFEKARKIAKEVQIGKKPFNFGKKMSKEAKNNMAKAHIGVKLSDYHKKRIGDGQRGIPQSEETKKKISESIKKHWEIRRARFYLNK